MGNVGLVFDETRGEYRLTFPGAIEVVASCLERGNGGRALYALVKARKDGKPLTQGGADLFDPAKLERLSRDAAAQNGIAPDYLLPYLKMAAHILDKEVSPFGGASTEWPVPQPLPVGLPPVAPFDEALLPEVLRPWVVDIAERMQCPLDFPAVAAMIAVAAVVGRQVGIRPKREDDWLVIPNLWGGIVGRPGVLKSPALAEPLRQVHRLEARAHDDYDQAQREFETARLIAEANTKETKKRIAEALRDGKDPQALAARLLESEPEAPVRRRYITNDTTVEKLGELLAENPRGLLVFRDELVGFLRSLDREGHEGARAFFLEAWNGDGRFVYDRIGRGTIDIDAACVSILGGIQPGPLMEYTAEAVRQGVGDDGLLQRFQLLAWPDIPQEWKNVDRYPNGEARRAINQLFDRLDALGLTTLDAHQSDEDALPWLRFTPEAQEEFDGWRTRLETRLRTGEEHPAFEAYLAKFRSLVPALALLCHLVDNSEGQVGRKALLHALAWAEYLDSHARRVYSHVTNPALAAAKELDRHIVAGDLGQRFTAREVYLKGWRMLDRDQTELALETLAALGRVRAESPPTGGRPKTVWVVNPALEKL